MSNETKLGIVLGLVVIVMFAVINALIATLQKYADGTPGRVIDVAAFKELAGVSRKYAIPLLEYFDRTKITQRSGEKRIVLK